MGLILNDKAIENNLKLDEKRIKTEFLFRPLTINGVTKWLEMAGYMEIKITKTMYSPINPTRIKEVIKWKKFKWL